MRGAITFVALALGVSSAYADVYLHMPRGSNNRLNEANNNRNNGNRLFDSQNNNRGGYNVGDTDETDGAGRMKFYAGSQLSVEWTNQHACNSDKNNCNIVLQYACGADMRDGTNTGTINPGGAENAGGDANKGKHESKAYYAKCQARERNRHLFTADQNVNGKDARFTRQNPNGNRRGLECPEERDYYPYWHPTPWKDVAVLTSEPERLCGMYRQESENVKGKGECSDPEYNNATTCAEEGGNWNPGTAHGLPAPDCIEAPWNRINHHGTTPYNTKEEFAPTGYKNPGEFNSYNWTIPNTPHQSCVFRLRYNISTGDYDGWDPKVNASLNGKASPVKQDPTVDIGYNRGLTLAINTAQFGRTFQDRSHVFSILQRPAQYSSGKIYNLNVRGRRGNIVQNYPAVEYDFVPKRLTVTSNDWVHFQWTGSNNNPNNDGEGAAQTDRNNIAQIDNARSNYPIKKEIASNPSLGGMFPDAATVQKFATLGDTQQKLNNASPYFNHPPMKFTTKGVFHYACLRNNNFSNRSQKGVLIVV